MSRLSRPSSVSIISQVKPASRGPSLKLGHRIGLSTATSTNPSRRLVEVSPIASKRRLASTQGNRPTAPIRTTSCFGLRRRHGVPGGTGLEVSASLMAFCLGSLFRRSKRLRRSAWIPKEQIRKGESLRPLSSDFLSIPADHRSVQAKAFEHRCYSMVPRRESAQPNALISA